MVHVLHITDYDCIIHSEYMVVKTAVGNFLTPLFVQKRVISVNSQPLFPREKNYNQDILDLIQNN